MCSQNKSFCLMNKSNLAGDYFPQIILMKLSEGRRSLTKHRMTEVSLILVADWLPIMIDLLYRDPLSVNGSTSEILVCSDIVLVSFYGLAKGKSTHWYIFVPQTWWNIGALILSIFKRKNKTSLEQ